MMGIDVLSNKMVEEKGGGGGDSGAEVILYLVMDQLRALIACS